LLGKALAGAVAAPGGDDEGGGLHGRWLSPACGRAEGVDLFFA
jgi:hypothetical protein